MGNNARKNSQSEGTRLTAEKIAEMTERLKNGPGLEEAMDHFGYETIGEWNNLWLNTPEQLEMLSSLPEIIKTLGLDKRYQIIFDYDPDYPIMLIQMHMRWREGQAKPVGRRREVMRRIGSK